MKKIFAILLIVGLLAGCAGTSFLCVNGPKVINGLQAVLTQANAVITLIQASYPGIIPPAAQTVLSAAQAAKDVASLAISKACPATADLVSAQQLMAMANQQLSLAVRAGNMKLGR